MYIRKSKTRTVQEKNYYSIRLVESARTSTGKVRQQTLLNLGSDYQAIAETQWPLLTDRIESILSGAQPLLSYDAHIEQEAQRLAHLVIKKRGQEVVQATPKAKQYETVDIDSLENGNVRSLGIENLAHEMAKRLNFPQILANCGFNFKQQHLALATIIGRLLRPGSEVVTCDYLRDKSALDEVLGVDFSTLHRNQLYAISDLLLKHKQPLEAQLFAHEKAQFKFKEVVTLYDLTNTYFEGRSEQNDYAALGRSKEKRSDCMLVSLALVLDGSGFPKHSYFYQGNISEPITLKQMVKDINKDAIVVMDAGIATEDNITWLTENKYNYLVISRKKNQEIPKDVTGVIVKEEAHNTVTSYLVKADQSDEIEMYCHSEAMEAKSQAMHEKFQSRLMGELHKLKNGFNIKGCVKKYDKVCQKVGRLKEKYSKVAKYYQIDVTPDDDKNTAIDIIWKQVKNKADKACGVYCIRTNQTQLDNQGIWQTYRMLNDVESAFRALKTDLGLRPIYHQKTDRVSGHIFISLLAYHLLHSIRYQLKSHGIQDSWQTIRTKLENHYRITTKVQKKEGSTLHIRKTMRPNTEQSEIYQACHVPLIPLKQVIKEY